MLGSKTLTVMKQALDNLGMTEEYLAGVPFTNRATYQLMCSGNTDGIFQLEGGTSRWGCRNLKPSTIHDVIAAMALFRPAAMNTGGTDAYIKRKHKKEEIPQRHPILMRVTAPTYGVLLYQEQVIDMLRALGMDADNLTKFLKAVKASNKDIGSAGVVIQGYQEWIQLRTEEMGFSADDRLYLDEAIAGFAEYGFNRAHATVYGITAYRCAYLATTHPLEFHAALLAVAAAGSSKRLPEYLRATRRRGIRVLQPHVNTSGSTYRVDVAQGDPQGAGGREGHRHDHQRGAGRACPLPVPRGPDRTHTLQACDGRKELRRHPRVPGGRTGVPVRGRSTQWTHVKRWR